MGEVLRSAGQTVTEEQLREMINQVDTNKNGTVEFEEFVELIAKVHATFSS